MRSLILLFFALSSGSSLFAQESSALSEGKSPITEPVYRCIMQNGTEMYDGVSRTYSFEYDIIPINGPDLMPTGQLEVILDDTQKPLDYLHIFSIGRNYEPDTLPQKQIPIAWEKGYVDFKFEDGNFAGLYEPNGNFVWKPVTAGNAPEFIVHESHPLRAIIPAGIEPIPDKVMTYRGNFEEHTILFGTNGVDVHNYFFAAVTIPQTNEGSRILRFDLSVHSDQKVGELKNVFKNGPPLSNGESEPYERFPLFIFKSLNGELVSISCLGSDWTWKPEPSKYATTVSTEFYTGTGPAGY